MKSVKWSPIKRSALDARVAQGVVRMNASQHKLWQAIRIDPERWEQHPYGDAGGGFWVVAIVGRSVIWYNDIEDGFNRSNYSTYGTLDDYWCNDDELELTLQYVTNSLETGADLLHLAHTRKKA